METSRLGFADWLDVGFELLTQLALVVGIFALAIWLWPDGILDAPIASIAFGMALSAMSSVVVWLVGLVALYFVVVEPVYKVARAD